MWRMIVLAALLFVAAVGVPDARALDSQSLVGEWQGEWSSVALAMTEKIYLTIKKIDGDQVDGLLYIKGPAPYHNRDIPVKGTLSGTTLSIAAKDSPLSMTFQVVKEDRMEGEGAGRARVSIWLKKK